MFKQNNKLCYGNIQKFIKNQSEIYFFIKLLDASKLDYEFNYTNQELLTALDTFHNFYIRLHESNQTVLVHSKNIINKCILIALNNYFIASPCIDLLEHD